MELNEMKIHPYAIDFGHSHPKRFGKKKPCVYIITESFGTSQQRPYAVSQLRKDFIGQAVKYQFSS